MTPELTALALAALLQIVQIGLVGWSTARDVGGSEWAGSPRDTPPPKPLSHTTGRLMRATSNHFEGLAFFTIAVLVTTLSGQSTAFTAACAWAYLGARVLYVPAYVASIGSTRSLVWTVGFVATLAMILAALF
ncbi:MAPEG family protein [Phaeovulum sp.]|uniref:MAPEG family protein n=1 Tax=Phaeovulum sp. TaxID=2934796 RepID=UPI00356314F0